MGWTYRARPADEDRECREEWRGDGLEVLASKVCRSHGGNSAVWYAAIRITKPTGSYVFAAVTLIDRAGEHRYPWLTKNMDETEGPNEHHCPAEVLALLSPLADMERVTGHKPGEWQVAWRRKAVLALPPSAPRIPAAIYTAPVAA